MKAQRLQLNCSPNRSRLHHQVTPKQKQPTFQTHRPSNRRAIVTLAKKMQSEIVANILDNTEVQHDLVEEAIAWASQHGLVRCSLQYNTHTPLILKNNTLSLVIAKKNETQIFI